MPGSSRPDQKPNQISNSIFFLFYLVLASHDALALGSKPPTRYAQHSTSGDAARRSTSRSTQRLNHTTHGARCSVPSTPCRLTRMAVLCLLSSVHDTVIKLDLEGVSRYWLDSLLLVSDFFLLILLILLDFTAADAVGLTTQASPLPHPRPHLPLRAAPSHRPPSHAHHGGMAKEQTKDPPPQSGQAAHLQPHCQALRN
jgi:hypothetical protein